MSGTAAGSSSPQEPLEPGAFQQLVLSALRDRWPDLTFAGDADPLRVQFGPGHTFGLHNLRKMADHGGMAAEEVKECAITAFERILALSRAEARELPPWDEARPLLRLQVMPREYPAQMSPPPLWFPLNRDVCTSIVLDQEHTYLYVNQGDLDAWQRSVEEVYSIATGNLEIASQGMAFQGSEGPNRCLGIEVKDGYDAARILLPALRAHLAQFLGSPFYAGIPNRDFLFCWAQNCAPDFHAMIRDKLEQNFRGQPYPLTPAVLVATADSVRPEQVESDE